MHSFNERIFRAAQDLLDRFGGDNGRSHGRC